MFFVGSLPAILIKDPDFSQAESLVEVITTLAQGWLGEKIPQELLELANEYKTLQEFLGKENERRNRLNTLYKVTGQPHQAIDFHPATELPEKQRLITFDLPRINADVKLIPGEQLFIKGK